MLSLVILRRWKGESLRKPELLLISQNHLAKVTKLRWMMVHTAGFLLNLSGCRNIFYWCGRLTNNDKDCDLWLNNKDNLSNESKQYGASMPYQDYSGSKYPSCHS